MRPIQYTFRYKMILWKMRIIHWWKYNIRNQVEEEPTAKED